MNRLLIAASSLVLVGAAACSDGTPDVVEAPTPTSPTATAAPVTDTRAETVATSTALAFGMTRDELQDADLMSTNNTDLGDVESLIVNANGQVTDFVIELEGPGDREVVVPLSQVSSIREGDDADLVTALSAAELAALPAWNPTTAR